MSVRVSGSSLFGALAVAVFLVPAASADDKKEPSKSDSWAPFDFLEMIQRYHEAQARAKAAENLRRIGMAIQEYEKLHPQKGTAPGVPWTYQLLPYIEQDSVWGHNWNPYFQPTTKLGVPLEPVGSALASQLKLAKDQGQVVGEVKKDSLAEKAGLKQHDILLEINGKPVSRFYDAFEKTMSELKAGTKVELLVLREGQQVGLKDVPLQEVKSPIPAHILDGTSNTIMFGEGRWPGPTKTYWAPSDPGTITTRGFRIISREPTLTTIFRDSNRYTARLEEGNLIITVVGTREEKGGKLDLVKVQDGGSEKRYTSLKDVPVEYRDKAAHLIDAGEKRD